MHLFLTTDMTDTLRCLPGYRKILSLEPKGRVDQGDQDRHFDLGTDDRGKGHTGVNGEDGNGQLKVIGNVGKGQCVACPQVAPILYDI